MENEKKESYTEPVLVAHELLRDVTGQKYRENKFGQEGPY